MRISNAAENLSKNAYFLLTYNDVNYHA